MKEAVKDADLVIESMAEIKDEKIKFYQTLAPLLEEKTVKNIYHFILQIQYGLKTQLK